MAHSNKDLLDLELKNSSSSNLESTLIVCKNDDLQQSQNSKPTPIDGKPFTSSVPKSHVMGKVKDFLGVMSEANQRLQNDAKDNVEDYDIEVLTGNESEYIEMDLMLGVADLHTPEAVSAAQSAIVASSSETESESSSDDSSDGDSEDDSDDDYNDDNATATPPKLKRAKSVEDDSSSESSKKHKPKKQLKIDLLVKPSSRIVDIFHITSFVHDFAYTKTFGIASQNVVSFSIELSRRNNSNYGLE
ncbi:hypothetical protein ACSBR1_008959 [Camellia fascicularis]